jgi:hypothetical protein
MVSPVATDAAHQKEDIRDEPSVQKHSGDLFTRKVESDDENCILVAPSAVSGRDKTSASTCGWRSIDVLTRFVSLIQFNKMKLMLIVT